MSRVLLAGCVGFVALALASTLPAAPVPEVSKDPTKDREGNPLPKGATARFGSIAFRGPQVFGLTFSPDGKRLLAASGQSVVVWDSDTGQPLPGKFAPPPDLATRQTHGPVVVGSRVVWLGPTTPPRSQMNEAILADFDGNEVTRFEFPGHGQRDYVVGSVHLSNFAISNDGKYLAATADRGVTVFDLQHGKKLHTQKFTPLGLFGVTLCSVTNVLFMRDTKTIRRYEIDTGKELPAFEEDFGFVDLLAVSPNGKHLITGTTQSKRITPERGQGMMPEETLVVRDPATGKRVGVLPLGGTPSSFAFVGPDSLIVFSHRFRHPAQGTSTYSRWNLTTREREWEVPSTSGPRIIASPDGSKFAATNGASSTQVYDARTGKILYSPPGHTGLVSWVSFSPDGKTVTTAGAGEIINWDVGGERKQRFALPELKSGRILGPSLGPVGSDHLAWLAFTDDECITPQLVGWDRVNNKIGWRMFLSGTGPEWVATPDGKRVVGTVANNAARGEVITVYDGPSGEALHEWRLPTPANGGINSRVKTLSADGKMLFIIEGDFVRGLDVATGNEVLKVKFDKPAGWVPQQFVLAVSPDGSRLAVSFTGRVAIYNVKTGKALAQHLLPSGSGSAAKFSPDGKQVALWPSAKTGIVLCDAESDAKPRLFDGGLSPPSCAAFNATGTSLAVGYHDGTALVWDSKAK